MHSIALTRGIRDSLHAYYVCVLREKASRSKQEWKVEKVYLKEELKGEERKNLYYPLKTTSSNHLMLKTKNLEFMEEKYCIIHRIAYRSISANDVTVIELHNTVKHPHFILQLECSSILNILS